MIPYDLLFEIYRRLSINDSISFYTISKDTYAAVSLYVGLRGKRGGLQLKSEQLALLEEMHSKPENHVKLLQVPPSTGKTALGIVWDVENRKALPNYGATAIRVPTVMVESWVKEFIRLYPTKYNDDPAKSSFLVFHTSNKPHLNYIKNFISKSDAADNYSIPKHVEVILSSISNWSALNDYISLSTQLGAGNYNYVKNIIIDEAHKAVNNISQIIKLFLKSGYLLLLTASDIIFAAHPPHRIYRKQELVAKAVPTIKNVFYDYSKTDELLEDLFKLNDKVVIFVSTIADMKTVKAISGVKNIKHKTDADITNFTDLKGKALLIVSFNKANYGININSDLVVMRDISKIDGGMFHQAQHRFIRITNTAEEVVFFNAIANYATDMYNIASAYIIREYGNVTIPKNPIGAKYPGVFKSFFDSKAIDVNSLNYEEIYAYCSPDTFKYKRKDILAKIRDKSFFMEAEAYFTDRNAYYDIYSDILDQIETETPKDLDNKVLEQIKQLNDIMN